MILQYSLTSQLSYDRPVPLINQLSQDPAIFCNQLVVKRRFFRGIGHMWGPRRHGGLGSRRPAVGVPTRTTRGSR